MTCVCFLRTWPHTRQTAYDIKDDAKRRAILLTSIGSNCFRVPKDLAFPDVPDTKTFDQSATLLRKHFGFRQNTDPRSTDPLLTPYKINGKMKIKKAQNYQWDPIQVHQ